MYLLGILVLSLLINLFDATRVTDDHMFVYHDASIIKSGTTFDRNARTRLVCASLCMQNKDCVALSYQNKTCRIETSGSLTTIPNVGAVTMTYSKGLTLQQDFNVTNSPSDQTFLFGHDGTTHAWSLPSTNSTDNQSVTAMMLSETTTHVDVSLDQTWPNTNPSEDLTTPRTDWSTTYTTRNHFTTNTHSTRLTAQDHVTTDTSTTDATARDTYPTNPLSTEAASLGPVTTDALQSDTTSHTSSMETTKANVWPSTTSDYIFVETLLNMFDAQAYCNNIGGKLLEIETSEKHQFLKTDILTSAPYSQFYWIGGYDYIGDGTFSWQSNPTAPIIYTHWLFGEPSASGTNLCLRSLNAWSHKWASSLCTEQYLFFCEKTT